MRKHKYAALSGAAVLFLSLIVLSISTGGQSGAPPASSATPAPAVPPSADSNRHCQDLREIEELSEFDCSEIERKLEAELAGLAARVEREVGEMQPKLAAKLDSLSDELARKEVKASAKAAEAEAKAAQAMAQEVVPLLEDEESGWLGVVIAEVTPEKAKELKLPVVRGVLVMEVEQDGPAAKAGLKENDVITEYDGQTVEGTVQFRRLVRETPAGRTISLSVIRDGRSQKLTPELGRRSAFWEKKMEKGMQGMMPGEQAHVYAFSMPDVGALGPLPEVLDWHTPLLGISAEDLRGQLGSYFGAPDGEGILVRDVRPGTPAEKAGLKAGDVITKVDGKPVKTLRELREQLRQKSDQKTVNLSVLRRGAEMTLPVTIEKPRPIETPHALNRAQL
jgi:serine protease Do